MLKLRISDISGSPEKVFKLLPRLKERSWQHGGEQQLPSRPTLMLPDEPKPGFAPIIVDQIKYIIREINEQGASVLLIGQIKNGQLSGYKPDICPFSLRFFRVVQRLSCLVQHIHGALPLDSVHFAGVAVLDCVEAGLVSAGRLKTAYSQKQPYDTKILVNSSYITECILRKKSLSVAILTASGSFRHLTERSSDLERI